MKEFGDRTVPAIVSRLGLGTTRTTFLARLFRARFLGFLAGSGLGTLCALVLPGSPGTLCLWLFLDSFSSRGRLLSGELEQRYLTASQLLDVLDSFCIFRSNEREGTSAGPAATSAADTVNIVVRMPGRIEVENMADAFDIETTRSDVRGAKDIDLTSLETIKLSDARGLIHVAMNLASTKTVLFEALGQFTHRGLAIAEDNSRRHIVRA